MCKQKGLVIHSTEKVRKRVWTECAVLGIENLGDNCPGEMTTFGKSYPMGKLPQGARI